VAAVEFGDRLEFGHAASVGDSEGQMNNPGAWAACLIIILPCLVIHYELPKRRPMAPVYLSAYWLAATLYSMYFTALFTVPRVATRIQSTGWYLLTATLLLLGGVWLHLYSERQTHRDPNTRPSPRPEAEVGARTEAA